MARGQFRTVKIAFSMPSEGVLKPGNAPAGEPRVHRNSSMRCHMWRKPLAAPHFAGRKAKVHLAMYTILQHPVHYSIIEYIGNNGWSD